MVPFLRAVGSYVLKKHLRAQQGETKGEASASLNQRLNSHVETYLCDV